jgi:hypothetical protein
LSFLGESEPVELHPVEADIGHGAILADVGAEGVVLRLGEVGVLEFGVFPPELAGAGEGGLLVAPDGAGICGGDIEAKHLDAAFEAPGGGHGHYAGADAAVAPGGVDAVAHVADEPLGPIDLNQAEVSDAGLVVVVGNEGNAGGVVAAGVEQLIALWAGHAGEAEVEGFAAERVGGPGGESVQVFAGEGAEVEVGGRAGEHCEQGLLRACLGDARVHSGIIAASPERPEVGQGAACPSVLVVLGPAGMAPSDRCGIAGFVERVNGLGCDRQIDSILLVQAGALGDTVLQLRIAEALRRARPAARIAWLGRDEWLQIAQLCSAVDEAAGLDRWGGHRLFEAGEATEADLAGFLGRFDLIVSGLAGPGSAAMGRLERFARTATVWYEPRPADGATGHVCRQWLEHLAGQMSAVQPAAGDVLRAQAARLASGAGALLQPRDEDLAEAGERLRAGNGRGGEGEKRRRGATTATAATGHSGQRTVERSRLVVVHPGSGGLRKCYPIERYVRACRVLLQRDMQPVMVLGPAEVERWGEQVGRLLRECKVIVDPPVGILVALARMAAAYVGNDSGPTHVAAAAGVATVAVFGPTEAEVWGPVGPRVTVLRSREWESGWGDVTAERVAEAAADS